MRLIDADELRTRMLDYYNYSWQLCEEINDFFANTPTVDTVKHGQWKKRIARGGFHEDWGYTCSECGVEFIDLHPAHYCPNCGACMD